MGILDLLDRIRGVPRVDGEPVLLVQDEELVRHLRRPDDANRSTSPPTTCGNKCGAALEERILATDLPGGSAELWDRAPIVLDVWVCLRCGSILYPRSITPERLISFGRRGAELARANRFREAEWWFTRITWDWPSWPNGHIDLSQALRGRLAAATDVATRSRLQRRAEAALDMAIQLAEREPAECSAELAFAYLGLAELAMERRAPEVARRAIDSCLAVPGLPPASAARAEEIGRYLDEERYIFADAAEIIGPYLDLSDRPAAPVDTPDARKRLMQAVESLEAHYDAHPAHWQSIWMAAMARATLGQTQQSLELWRRAWSDHPAEGHIVREYGRALLRVELNEEARDVNRDATERLPDDALHWCNRAVTEVLCGDLAAARSSVHRSRELDPQDPIAKALERRLASLSPDRLPRSLRELEGR